MEIKTGKLKPYEIAEKTLKVTRQRNYAMAARAIMHDLTDRRLTDGIGIDTCNEMQAIYEEIIKQVYSDI